MVKLKVEIGKLPTILKYVKINHYYSLSFIRVLNEVARLEAEQRELQDQLDAGVSPKRLR